MQKNVHFVSKRGYDRIQTNSVRQISALLTIALAILLTGMTAAPVSYSATRSRAAKRTQTRAPSRNLIDINHASIEQLKSLPDIQDALAAKIVKNRPYANKTQLSSKGVIPAATYKKIRPLIIAKQ